MQRKSFIAGLSGLFLADTATAEPMNIDISIPGDGSALKGVVPVTVQASPTKNLERVVLEIDGVLVGSDAADPYVFSWDTTTVADGQHTITAKAHYRNRTSSGTLQVWVANVVVAPVEWVKVADEGGNFTLTETQEVRYGANGVYNTKVLAVGTYACTNTFFGDPIVGVRKVCEARDTIAEPPTSGWPAAFYTGPAGQNIALPPRQGVFAGAASGAKTTTTDPDLLVMESMVGRKMDVENRFMQQGVIDVPLINAIHARGHIPMVSFLPVPRNGGRILRGEADANLRAAGQALASCNAPKIILRIYWEFNGNWFEFSKDTDGSMLTTEEWKQVWIRSVDRLREGGAFPKCAMHWCPSEGYYNRPVWIDALASYPGDNYVDYVGGDGYGHSGRQFSEIIGLTKVEADFRTRKPSIVGETSAHENVNDPNWKGNWWRNARDHIKATMPSLVGFTVFDVQYTDGDWRVASSEQSKQGYIELVNDAYFNTRT
jgi:hypothetical protein